MKSTALLFVLVVAVFSCNEADDNTPVGPVNDNFDPNAMDVTLVKHGTLVGIGHTVMGEAKVYDAAGEIVVVLDPYSSQNGPDLKVYLSKDENAKEYLNLGPLKSVNGKQSYNVDGASAPDLSEYKYLIIWCEKFSVLFGRAELMMP